jgi:hypothetical protein
MKVLELQLPEPTAAKLQEAAERLNVSPERLSILSIEEKLAQLEEEFGTRRNTCFRKTPTSIADFPDAAC